jgi:hypothetical protein
MALLGTVTKQSREVLDFDIDYSTVLAGRSDSIVSQTAEVTPSGLTVDSITRLGSVVKVTYSGGINSNLYKITVLATSSVGLVYEDEVNILISDV